MELLCLNNGLLCGLAALHFGLRSFPGTLLLLLDRNAAWLASGMGSLRETFQWVASLSRGSKDHINLRIPTFWFSRQEDNADPRNHGLQDPDVYVVFWATALLWDLQLLL